MKKSRPEEISFLIRTVKWICKHGKEINIAESELKSQFALQSLNRIDESQFKYNQWNVYKV